MRRVDKLERVNSLEIKFNGKMLIVIDTDDWGPLEFSVDDKDMVVEVMRTLINGTDGIYDVKSYTKAEGKKLKKMMEEK